jgi:DNA-binding NarL/FixJ family response regulator
MPAIKDLVRIAVADDNLSVLQLFSNHINTLDNCKVIVQAGNGAELLQALKEKPGIDLVILDIMMPALNGYETATIIRKSYPGMRILFYSVCKTDLAMHLMALSGGHGLIQKGGSTDEAKKAIKSVMKGKYYFPALADDIDINGTLFAKLNGGRTKLITTAEVNFIRLCVSEMPYKEMAGLLNITGRQLEHLRETIFKKLHVKSRVGLVLKALDSGLAPFLQVNEIPRY